MVNLLEYNKVIRQQHIIEKRLVVFKVVVKNYTFMRNFCNIFIYKELGG